MNTELQDNDTLGEEPDRWLNVSLAVPFRSGSFELAGRR